MKLSVFTINKCYRRNPTVFLFNPFCSSSINLSISFKLRACPIFFPDCKKRYRRTVKRQKKGFYLSEWEMKIFKIQSGQQTKKLTPKRFISLKKMKKETSNNNKILYMWISETNIHLSLMCEIRGEWPHSINKISVSKGWFGHFI